MGGGTLVAWLMLLISCAKLVVEVAVYFTAFSVFSLSTRAYLDYRAELSGMGICRLVCSSTGVIFGCGYVRMKLVFLKEIPRLKYLFLLVQLLFLPVPLSCA